MNKFILISYFIITSIIISGCSKILEPVTLVVQKNSTVLDNEQEEFSFEVKALTFKTAQLANKSSYTRQIMIGGSGSQANILNETDLLNVSVPKINKNNNYFLGYEDELKFTLFNEFNEQDAQWPGASVFKNYLLGIGDELTFVQLNEAVNDNIVNFDADGNLTVAPNQKDPLIKTTGSVGSDGNLLLLGVGNVSAINRTINDVRTEVRNILIRNGLAPNFQLEISNFKSKKAHVNIKYNKSYVIPLSNIPVTLNELAIEAGISKSSNNSALLTLTRGSNNFKITASQLFGTKAPEIFIQNKDQIEIEITNKEPIQAEAAIGSNGNILLPKVGMIKAAGRTLGNVQLDINKKLNELGLMPNFQLEVTKYKSKKIFITYKNTHKEKTIHTISTPLTSTNTSLKEVLLRSKNPISTNSLSIVTLTRNKKSYQMTMDYLLNRKTPDIWLYNRDRITIENFSYKSSQVFALSGANNAKIIDINPSKRETLADILFVNNGILSNVSAKRSDVYLLRGRKPSSVYHLDAQNVSRILVAAETELRPNDIIYVADRPIISFARTLAEVSPLRILLRDLFNDNIP